MIYRADEINERNFKNMLPELIKQENSGVYDYEFLLEVCKNITEEQEDVLIPYIIDRFVTENFEEAEWEGRFKVLEDAKKIYVDAVFKGDPDFRIFRISGMQDVVICIGYPHQINETLVIPTDLFKTDLAPMEIIVYTLKKEWGKDYSQIAKILNRDPTTIETTFKRAVWKMRSY